MVCESPNHSELQNPVERQMRSDRDRLEKLKTETPNLTELTLRSNPKPMKEFALEFLFQSQSLDFLEVGRFGSGHCPCSPL